MKYCMICGNDISSGKMCQQCLAEKRMYNDQEKERAKHKRDIHSIIAPPFSKNEPLDRFAISGAVR